MSNRSYDETSLMDEMSPRISSGKGFDDTIGDGLNLGNDDINSEIEEVQDRFSLKGVESKKVAEAVSYFFLSIHEVQTRNTDLCLDFRLFRKENTRNYWLN